MYLLKSSTTCQINIQFNWARELVSSTVVCLVSLQPRFHAALFKKKYTLTKVGLVVFVLFTTPKTSRNKK